MYEGFEKKLKIKHIKNVYISHLCARFLLNGGARKRLHTQADEVQLALHGGVGVHVDDVTELRGPLYRRGGVREEIHVSGVLSA